MSMSPQDPDAEPQDAPQELEALLGRLRAGDLAARDQIMARSCDRLRRLTRKMLRGYQRLRRWEETDDVFQHAALRLHRSLRDVRPANPAHYFALAATQIRRTLIDLARHHFGPEGAGAHHHTDRVSEDGRGAVQRISSPTGEPRTLQQWTDFHEKVEMLPEKERDVFNLLWYEGLTQTAAAQVLEVDVRTVKRRWQSAKILLHQQLESPPAT